MPQPRLMHYIRIASHAAHTAGFLIAKHTGKPDTVRRKRSISDLVTEIDKLADEPTKRRKGWPPSPKKLSGDLRRIAPNLRSVGIDAQRPSDTGRSHRRLIVLEKLPCAVRCSDGVSQDFCKSTNEDEELVI